MIPTPQPHTSPLPENVLSQQFFPLDKLTPPTAEQHSQAIPAIRASCTKKLLTANRPDLLIIFLQLLPALYLPLSIQREAPAPLNKPPCPVQQQTTSCINAASPGNAARDAQPTKGKRLGIRGHLKRTLDTIKKCTSIRPPVHSQWTEQECQPRRCNGHG